MQIILLIIINNVIFSLFLGHGAGWSRSPSWSHSALSSFWTSRGCWRTV